MNASRKEKEASSKKDKPAPKIEVKATAREMEKRKTRKTFRETNKRDVHVDGKHVGQVFKHNKKGWHTGSSKDTRQHFKTHNEAASHLHGQMNKGGFSLDFRELFKDESILQGSLSLSRA